MCICVFSQIFRAKDQVERFLAVGGAVMCLPMNEESAWGLPISGAPYGRGFRYMCVSALFSKQGLRGGFGGGRVGYGWGLEEGPTA